MPSIHFICRGGLNLHVVKHPVYECGVWDVENDAPKLVGGMLHLHEAKADSSYFGGRIESSGWSRRTRPTASESCSPSDRYGRVRASGGAAEQHHVPAGCYSDTRFAAESSSDRRAPLA